MVRSATTTVNDYRLSSMKKCRGPREGEFSSEVGMEKAVGNRTIFSWKAHGLFGKSKDLFFTYNSQ